MPSKLTFTHESKTFVYPDVIEVGKGKKKTKKKITVPVQVTKIACPEVRFLAFAFVTAIAEDADGAPSAYGVNNPKNPLQQGLKPSDHLANAAIPTSAFPKGIYHWTGVVAATKAYAKANNLQIDERYCATGKDNTGAYPGKSINVADAATGMYPVIQTEGATKGYFVSPSDRVKKGDETDQSIYINPLDLPLMVLTGIWKKENVKKGDFGWGCRPDFTASSGFCFADNNGSNHVGEISYGFSGKLNRPHFGCFLVFPGSGPGNLFGVDMGKINVSIRTEFSKLKDVENKAEFVEFLNAGADLGKLIAGAKASSVKKQMDPKLVAALTQAGFPF